MVSAFGLTWFSSLSEKNLFVNQLNTTLVTHAYTQWLTSFLFKCMSPEYYEVKEEKLCVFCACACPKMYL